MELRVNTKGTLKSAFKHMKEKGRTTQKAFSVNEHFINKGLTSENGKTIFINRFPSKD